MKMKAYDFFYYESEPTDENKFPLNKYVRILGKDIFDAVLKFKLLYGEDNMLVNNIILVP
jgi:hypothetical protein